MNTKDFEDAFGRLFKPKKLTKVELQELIDSYRIEPGAVFNTEYDVFEPQSFDEYIGQAEAKTILQIMALAAEKEDRALPNLLISGGAGLGKTTLAKILLKGKPYSFVDGNSVNATFTTLNGYVIIDEVHNVKPDVCDSLNVILDQGQLRIIGCTTNPGLLPSPFRSRFRSVDLTPYTTNDLIRILQNVLVRKGTLQINDSLLKQIAKRARRTPRTALKILSFIMDIMIVNNEKTLTTLSFNRSLEMLGLDDEGLLPIDRRFLAAFPENNQPVGLQYLAAVTGIDAETIENEIEPWLMTLKKLNRTSKGRVLINVPIKSSVLQS